MTKKILDLGCGCESDFKRVEGDKNKIVIGLDIKPCAEVVHDMNKYPYPFKNNEFDELHLNHSEYYVKDKKKLMKELYRIAKPGAKIVIRSIHTSRWYSKKRFAKYPDFRTVDEFRQFDSRFKLVKLELHYFLWQVSHWKKILSLLINILANISPKFCERVWCYIVGGFDEIEGEFAVKK